MATQPICPLCGSHQVFRSHRSLLERLLVVMRPYRCGICHHRFTLLQLPGTRPPAGPQPPDSSSL